MGRKISPGEKDIWLRARLRLDPNAYIKNAKYIKLANTLKIGFKFMKKNVIPKRIEDKIKIPATRASSANPRVKTVMTLK